MSYLRQWCASWGSLSWGTDEGFGELRFAPNGSRSRCGLEALSLLGAAAAPRSGGGPRLGPPSWRAFSCLCRYLTFFALKKGRWVRWGTNCDFCPFLFPSAKPDRKGHVLNVLQDRLGKAANVAVFHPLFLTGVAAMFREHKMATRGPDSSPRNWDRHESCRIRPRCHPQRPCPGACLTY